MPFGTNLIFVGVAMGDVGQVVVLVCSFFMRMRVGMGAVRLLVFIGVGVVIVVVIVPMIMKNGFMHMVMGMLFINQKNGTANH